MRHIVSAQGASAFSFALPAPAMERLMRAAEEYVSECLERRFRSLEYYYDVRIVPES